MRSELTEPFIEKMNRIEAKMLQLPQANCPVTHKFQDGFYIRELEMKAGTLAIGHYQNFEHLNVFLKGKVMILNDDGTTSVLTAPMTFIGKPGRKVGLVLEDMVWQNVYVTQETDVELLEAQLLTKSDTFHALAAHKYALEYVNNEHERQDYVKLIAEVGYTEEQVQEEVQNTEDQVEMPEGLYKVQLGLSTIHGTGVIASSNIEANEVIGPAKVGFFRTPLGRFTNHSINPNAEMKHMGNDVYLVATKDIKGAHGGQPGEEVTIDYRATLKLIRG